MKFIFWSIIAVGIYAYFMLSHEETDSYTKKTFAYCEKRLQEKNIQVHVNKWFNDTPKEKKEPAKKSYRRSRRMRH